MDNIFAIIPAGGFSSRMGEYKPLLPVGGLPAIRGTVEIALAAGAHPVVVTGFRAEDLERALDGSGALLAHNAEYASGMFSSVLTGARALPGDASAFFLLPADCRAVRPETLKLLISEAEHREGIVFPTYEGRRGHPPLIPGALLPGLLAHGGEDGARGYFDKFPSSGVETDDPGVLLDMDTPRDYAATLTALGLPTYPLEAECRALFRKYGTAEDIIRHGEQVAELCARVAAAMNSCGFAVDANLLFSAALLHDISRAEPEHERRGFELLLREGYPAAAELVLGHMDAPPEDAPRELELLFVADKLCRRGRLAPPEETLAALRVKFRDDGPARAAAEVRMAACEALLEKYARVYGVDVINA
ncbi:MAG: NTP transferase domain-containing protein [Oscillospiraceae bacterium]|jgi:CTP:molybdopterin cytidylyltransferase MocA|nr:NTP transferase domain-containing protein [Oscillospiraceae bacterium]